MKPICVTCQVAMRIEENGFIVHDEQRGSFPPTYWHSDRWKCPSCGTEIATGFGQPMQHDKLSKVDLARAVEFAHEYRTEVAHG